MSGDYGIPLSGNEPMSVTAPSGVTYDVRVPVGATEREIRKIQRQSFDVRPYMEAASAAVDNEHKGKRWKAGERLEAIAGKAQEFAESSFWEQVTPERNDEQCDAVFDCICKGWDKGANLPKGDKPSDHVRFADKEYVVNWYLKQMQLTPDERKNS